MCIFTRVPIDIVEMVIVISDNYDLFKIFKKLLFKLQDDVRVARINDKMTKVYIQDDFLLYKLNGRYHREYNKPCFISYETNGLNLHYHYLHNNNNKPNRVNGFSMICENYRDNEKLFLNRNIERKQILFINNNKNVIIIQRARDIIYKYINEFK